MLLPDVRSARGTRGTAYVVHANTALIQCLERINVVDTLLDVFAEELAGIITAKAHRHLCQAVGLHPWLQLLKPFGLLFLYRPSQVGDVFGFDKFYMAVGEGDVGAGIVFAVAVGDDIIRPANLIPPGSAFKQ